ncbi:MAG: hypothetical protein WCF67_18190 [Chitinophagaceae bacterium]
MASAIGVIVVLAWMSTPPSESGDNIFNRKIISGEVKLLNEIEKEKNVIDFAGAIGSDIYFKTIDPSIIYKTDNRLENKESINLNIPAISVIASMFKTFVDSGGVTIFANNVPAIVKAKPGSDPKLIKFPGALFTRGVQISSNSFVLRMFERTNQIFAKWQLNTKEIIKETGISEKTGDAGISTDGMLHFDRKTNSLVYACYYQNEILQLDTNLNLIRKMKTVDAKTTSLLKAGRVQTSSQDVITNLSPKQLVNGSSCVSDGYLFIDSKTFSHNEIANKIENVSVIDIYNMEQGRYEGSFYIPYYKSEKIKTFKVLNNTLVVIYRKYLVTYAIPYLNL